MPDFFLQAHHQVQRGDGGKVENRIGGKDGVIKTENIEPDNQISPAEVLNQLFGILFQIDPVLTAVGVIKHGHRKAHFVDMGPSPDLRGDFLGFQIEVNDLGHTNS